MKYSTPILIYFLSIVSVLNAQNDLTLRASNNSNSYAQCLDTIIQIEHGFDILNAVDNSSGYWKLADTIEHTNFAEGVVTKVIDKNTFCIAKCGIHSIPNTLRQCIPYILTTKGQAIEWGDEKMVQVLYEAINETDIIFFWLDNECQEEYLFDDNCIFLNEETLNKTIQNNYLNAFTQNNMEENEVEVLLNYNSLRAFSGEAEEVLITTPSLSGEFAIDAINTADDGAIHIVDAIGRTWKRQNVQYIDPDWFGAIPDADIINKTGTDNAAAFQAASDYCEAHNLTFRTDGGAYVVKNWYADGIKIELGRTYLVNDSTTGGVGTSSTLITL